MYRFWFTIACLALNAGCGQLELTDLSRPTPKKITLTGSSTIAPMISEIAKRFEVAHPHVRVEVQTGGSSRGIKDARSGATDIGMSSRDLKADETAGVQTEVIGWDGVAFVVHADNPIGELTKEQLRLIYTNQVINWQSLNGPNAPIVVSNRAEGRSELELMAKFLDVTVDQIHADVIDGDTQQSIKTVATNPNAISYTSIGAAQYAVEQNQPLKLLPLDGTTASAGSVQSGKFPVARPLVLIVKANQHSALIDAFLAYAKSPAVDDITRSLGYVPPRRDEVAARQEQGVRVDES